MDYYGTSVGDLMSVRTNGGFTLTGVTLTRFHCITIQYSILSTKNIDKNLLLLR